MQKSPNHTKISYANPTIFSATERRPHSVIFPNQQQKLHPTSIFPQILQSAQDVEYLSIIYFKWDRNDTVSSNQNISIDYITAISEMEKLDWTFVHNHIGFTNKKKWITIQFIKRAPNKWYVEELINSAATWDGYLWWVETDTVHLQDMLWRFYHEEPFAQTILGWQLKQVRGKD